MAIDTTTAIERLAAQIAQRFPEVEVTIDRPGNPRGSWFLDAKLADKFFNVEWRPEDGFGISWRQDPVYGEGPDQAVDTYEEALARSLEIVAAMVEEVKGSHSLRALRRQLGLSQSHLASLLNIRQGAVSRLERREDMLVSSLREYIKCFGGELQLVARFPDGSEQRIQLGSDAPTKADKKKP